MFKAPQNMLSLWLKFMSCRSSTAWLGQVRKKEGLAHGWSKNVQEPRGVVAYTFNPRT